MTEERVSYKAREDVEVFDGKKWRATKIDALPGPTGEYGWVCVDGWPGRAGTVSVRLEAVRKKNGV